MRLLLHNASSLGHLAGGTVAMQSWRRHVVAGMLALSAGIAVGTALLLLAGVAAGGARPAAERAQALGTAEPPAATPTAQPLIAGRPNVPRPDLPSRLAIPAIGLDAPIVDVGTTVEKGQAQWETAAFAVGYYRTTALPGSRGNTVMAGHISSPVSNKGDVFRHLPEVHIGDAIDVYMGGRLIAYEVTAVRVVPPSAVDVMNGTPDATLTLLTCYPDLVYTKRYVVIGKLANDRG